MAMPMANSAKPFLGCNSVFCTLFSVFIINCLSHSHAKEDSRFPNDSKPDFYSYTVKDHTGQLVSLEKYRNKVTLVLNVASQCGFTDSHYKSLIRMKNLLAVNDNFEILAFPCNQFGAQEPWRNEEIQNFVRETYHVNFPVFGKINVLNEDVPDAFQFLIDSTGVTPTWNFWKYLVNEKGQVIQNWPTQSSIEDIFHEVKEIVDNIGHDQPSYKRSHLRMHEDL